MKTYLQKLKTKFISFKGFSSFIFLFFITFSVNAQIDKKCLEENVGCGDNRRVDIIGAEVPFLNNNVNIAAQLAALPGDVVGIYVEVISKGPDAPTQIRIDQNSNSTFTTLNTTPLPKIGGGHNHETGMIGDCLERQPLSGEFETNYGIDFIFGPGESISGAQFQMVNFYVISEGNEDVAFCSGTTSNQTGAYVFHGNFGFSIPITGTTNPRDVETLFPLGDLDATGSPGNPAIQYQISATGGTNSPIQKNTSTTMPTFTSGISYELQNQTLTAVPGTTTNVNYEFCSPGGGTGASCPPSLSSNGDSFIVGTIIVNSPCDPSQCGNFLPVELISFEGKESGSNAILNWSTATELDNKLFEVEASLDGISFNKVGTIFGNGTTRSEHHYEFTHLNASSLGSSVYYRLKQIDFSGSFEYSKITYVNFSGANLSQALFPNPAVQGSDVVLQSSNIELLEIYSMNGRLAQTLDFKGKNKITTINTSGLSRGVYLIRINQQEIKKLVIQ